MRFLQSEDLGHLKEYGWFSNTAATAELNLLNSPAGGRLSEEEGGKKKGGRMSGGKKQKEGRRRREMGRDRGGGWEIYQRRRQEREIEGQEGGRRRYRSQTRGRELTHCLPAAAAHSWIVPPVRLTRLRSLHPPFLHLHHPLRGAVLLILLSSDINPVFFCLIRYTPPSFSSLI